MATDQSELDSDVGGLSTSKAFQELTNVLAVIERMNVTIGRVIPSEQPLTVDDNMGANIEMTIDVSEALSGVSGAETTIVRTEAQDDGRVICELNVTITEEAGQLLAGHGPRHPVNVPSPDRGASQDNGTPTHAPHRDPKQLQAVYEQCESFPEMTEALGVDVTPETVRQQMIKHGIHEPERATERADDPTRDPEEQPPSADSTTVALSDILAPDEQESFQDEATTGHLDDTDMGEFVDTLENANTIREVGKRLQIERADAQTLLDHLGLLDLVMGRIANHTAEEIAREEITTRVENVVTSRTEVPPEKAPDDT